MSIFKDKTEFPSSSDQEVVRTIMVPGDTRDHTIKTINLAKYENSPVSNLIRPRLGHGY